MKKKIEGLLSKNLLLTNFMKIKIMKMIDNKESIYYEDEIPISLDKLYLKNDIADYYTKPCIDFDQDCDFWLEYAIYYVIKKS